MFGEGVAKSHFIKMCFHEQQLIFVSIFIESENCDLEGNIDILLQYSHLIGKPHTQVTS